MRYVWLFAPPLATTAVWIFLNNQRIIRVETEIPYPVFVLIGTTVWTSLANIVQQPLMGFENARPILMKLKVPVEAFIFSAMLRSFFDALLRFALLIPVFLIFKYEPSVGILLTPLVFVMVAVTAFALGIALVPLGALYGDVNRALTTFLGFFLYTAPIVYPYPESGMMRRVMDLNPITPGINLFRDLITGGACQSMQSFLIVFFVSILISVTGLVALRLAAPHMVERLGM